MSWVEKVKSGIKITTGDGKIYSPLLMITEKTVEYNVSEFDFVGIEGTLVKRAKPRGRRYNFDLTFQGDDHLDVSESFETSAKDPRPWNVFHPFYGKILLQPLGLKFDPSGFNTTKITGEMVETISDEYPVSNVDALSKIDRLSLDSSATLAAGYSDNVIPTANDVNDLNGGASDSYSLGSESVMSESEANSYFQLYQKSISAINTASSNVSLAATMATALFLAPALFTSQISFRLNTLLAQYNTLVSGITELITPNQKSGFYMNGGAIINAMALASINPIDGDYSKSKDVFIVIDDIVNTYNDFITQISGLQSDNGANIESYIPDFVGLVDLSELVNFTVSNLMDIALSSKQERTYILAYDSNPILLAHRFYGLLADDSTIDDFIDTNDIELDEIFILPAGKPVLYYV